MNEGENSGIPQSPVFSSPNITSNDNQAQFDQGIEEVSRAITSSDIAAMSNTGAGTVAAAAAAMTESDARPAVISSASQGGSSKTHANFSGRRFRAKESQPSSGTVFAGAPDYFNQAASDIYIDNSQPRKTNKKKFIVLGIAAIAIVVGVAIFFTMQPGTMFDKRSDAEKAAAAFKTEDVTYISRLESLYRHIVSGETRSSDVFVTEEYNRINEGLEAYKRVYNELKTNKESISRAVKGVDLNSILDRMSANLSIFESNIAEYTSIYNSLKNNDDGYLDKVSESNKEKAKEYVSAYRTFAENDDKKKAMGGCMDISEYEEDPCDVYDDAMKKSHSIMKNSTLAKDVLMGSEEEKITDNFVAKDVSKAYSSLKGLESKDENK